MNTRQIMHMVIFVFLFMSLPAEAFQLTAEGSFIERKLASRSQDAWEKVLARFALRGIHKIGEPVHEEITNRILGCEGDQDVCGATDYDTRNAYIFAGTRWNDDPPFRFEQGQGRFRGCEPGSTIRLVTFPSCWAAVFKDGEKRAKEGDILNGSNATLLVRSHFGDMQFLHAMASRDGESAATVRERIMTWAEFTWRVALGEFPLSTRLKNVPIKGIADLFKDKGWSIQDLFALGNPHVRKPEYMSELAFGSLLHMVEDSFADSHVERATPYVQEKCAGTAPETPMPGKIMEFHFYAQQDSSKHGNADTRSAFSKHWSDAKPNVVNVGRVLNEYFVRRVSWNEVKPYVECIFTLDIEARPSGAGESYTR